MRRGRADLDLGSRDHFAERIDRIVFADLLATVVITPLAYGAVEPWAVALFELNALLIAVLLVIKFVFAPGASPRLSRIILPLAALLLVGIVQLIPLGEAAPGLRTLSFDPFATREAVVKLLAYLIYFIAAFDVLRQRERRRKMLILLTALGFALAVFAIIQRLTWNGKIYWVRPVSPERAPFGPFVNPNNFAGMMEMIFPLAFAHLMLARVEFEQRLFWLFAAVMMAVSIVLSLSRGGLLTLGIEIMAFAVVGLMLRSAPSHEQTSRRPLIKQGALIGLLVVAIASLALWIGYDQIAFRLRTVNQGSQELSFASRLSAWRASSEMIKDHPLMGVGLGAFPTAYPSYGRSSAMRERLEQTHNDYLQLLTDAGLIGGAIGLWFLIELVLAARRGWRGLQTAHGLERSLYIGGSIAVVGLMVHSLTDFNLQITSNALLFLLIVALSTPLDPNRKMPES